MNPERMYILYLFRCAAMEEKPIGYRTFLQMYERSTGQAP